MRQLIPKDWGSSRIMEELSYADYPRDEADAMWARLKKEAGSNYAIRDWYIHVVNCPHLHIAEDAMRLHLGSNRVSTSAVGFFMKSHPESGLCAGLSELRPFLENDFREYASVKVVIGGNQYEFKNIPRTVMDVRGRAMPAVDKEIVAV
jgi:hypothetical protein